MRVIITGGTGLIGRALAASLVADGHEVIALSRSPSSRQGQMPANVRLVQWDGKTADGWGPLAEGAGAIVNLAGENLAGGRWTPEMKRRIMDSRTNAGQAVVAAVAAASSKPAVLIQSSAVGYYGARGDELITEAAGPRPQEFQSQVCLAWEKSTEAVEAMGVRRAVIRQAVVLDRREGALPRMLLPFQFFVGGPVGSGRQWFPWIHLPDEVAAIRFLMDNPQASGVFNLAAPQTLTNRDFARAIGQAMGRPALIPVPAFAMRLLFGEMSTVLLDGQRVVPDRLQQMGFTFLFPRAEPALRDVLGK